MIVTTYQVRQLQNLPQKHLIERLVDPQQLDRWEATVAQLISRDEWLLPSASSYESSFVEPSSASLSQSRVLRHRSSMHFRTHPKSLNFQCQTKMFHNTPFFVIVKE